jgi:hypothetical protein
MRIPIFAALIIIAFTGAANARSRETGEEELARMLVGRVAEQPVDCIRTWPSRSSNVIDGTAIVFGRGDVIYVNRTRDPASIDDNDALLIRKFGDATRLCRTDIVTTFDTTSRFYSGNVFLTEFVPYRRVRR